MLTVFDPTLEVFALPYSVVLTGPESASDTAADTSAFGWFSTNDAALQVTVGAVLSTLIPDCWLSALFPALSSQVPVTERLLPSPLVVSLTDAATGPDSESLQFQ